MKSVGEVMAIGRTFKEAFGRRGGAWRSPAPISAPATSWSTVDALALLGEGSEGRFHLIERALDAGHSVEEIAAASSVDPWFVDQMSQVWGRAGCLRRTSLDAVGANRLLDGETRRPVGRKDRTGDRVDGNGRAVTAEEQYVVAAGG